MRFCSVCGGRHGYHSVAHGKTMIDTKDARIAELEAALLAVHDGPLGDVNELSMRLEQAEAELATVNSLLDMKREREQHWSDEAWRYKKRAEQAEAEHERLRKGLRLIIERPPRQAHRIAIQMLGAERITP